MLNNLSQLLSTHNFHNLLILIPSPHPQIPFSWIYSIACPLISPFSANKSLWASWLLNNSLPYTSNPCIPFHLTLTMTIGIFISIPTESVKWEECNSEIMRNMDPSEEYWDWNYLEFDRCGVFFFLFRNELYRGRRWGSMFTWYRWRKRWGERVY